MNEHPPVNGPFRGLIIALSAMAVFGCGCSLSILVFFHWLGGV